MRAVRDGAAHRSLFAGGNRDAARSPLGQLRKSSEVAGQLALVRDQTRYGGIDGLLLAPDGLGEGHLLGADLRHRRSQVLDGVTNGSLLRPHDR